MKRNERLIWSTVFTLGYVAGVALLMPLNILLPVKATLALLFPALAHYVNHYSYRNPESSLAVLIFNTLSLPRIIMEIGDENGQEYQLLSEKVKKDVQIAIREWRVNFGKKIDASDPVSTVFNQLRFEVVAMKSFDFTTAISQGICDAFLEEDLTPAELKYRTFVDTSENFTHGFHLNNPEERKENRQFIGEMYANLQMRLSGEKQKTILLSFRDSMKSIASRLVKEAIDIWRRERNGETLEGGDDTFHRVLSYFIYEISIQPNVPF